MYCIDNKMEKNKHCLIVMLELRWFDELQSLLYLGPEFCEITFIRWHQFSWFLQNALIPGFLNSWFQVVHVFRWILIFMHLMGTTKSAKLEAQ
jgi:hypothetical protein